MFYYPDNGSSADSGLALSHFFFAVVGVITNNKLPGFGRWLLGITP
jgi:hypothetical protein